MSAWYEYDRYPRSLTRNPKTTKGRAAEAIRQILWLAEKPAVREFGRSFDDCFEAGDGTAVVKSIVAQASNDDILARAMRRANLERWLEEYTPQATQESLF